MKCSEMAGKVKIWEQRLASYMSMVNFAMIFYLYLIETPLGLSWLYWLVIVFAGIVVVLFIDIRFIMPASLDYHFNKNPELVRMRDDVREVKRLLMEDR